MKTNIGNTPYLYPIPIVLVGCIVNGKYNFAEIGDVAIMGIKPALMSISLNENHLTTKGISKSGKFSINIPTADMIKSVDYCGIYSGSDKDKSSLFTMEEHEPDIPMIKECPVNIACTVVKDFFIEHRHIFIAKVMSTYVDEDYIVSEGNSKKIADLNMLNPLIYGLDNKYYTIGEQIGTGYAEGSDLKLEDN